MIWTLKRHADDYCGLLVGHVLDALHGFEVKLHPDALVLLVDETISVGAVAVHVPVGLRPASIAHQPRHLMQSLGQQRKPIPHRGGIVEVGLGVAFLLADEVGKLVGVAHPENGRVVADKVPVAFLGINLDCETPKVALGVGRSALSGDVRETHETLALRARLQGLGLGVAAEIATDLERTVSAGALGMDDALGNALAVEGGVLLEQLPVLHQ